MTCIGRPDSEVVPADGLASYFCPQPSQRSRLEAPGTPAVRAKAATLGGHPLAKVALVEEPARRSYSQPSAGRTMVEKADEYSCILLVDGRCFAQSALFPPGAGLLAAVLPLAPVSFGAT